jgi:hypothetical protein
MAELLHRDDVVELLQQTLDEEKAADRKLTEVVENQIYPQALASGEPEPEHDGIARQSEEAQTLESTRHS